MAANSLGHCLQLHTFGESHGPALGAIVEGVPAGTPWRPEILKQELERRRPGTAPWVSARQEEDQPEVLSGVYENKFLGTPVAVIVRNTDARPADYAQIAQTPRAGHADDVWKDKFGFSDPRGGGRSSGRETLSRVIGGAMARMILGELCPDLKVRGFITALGPHSLNEQEVQEFLKSDNSVDHFEARFPSRRTKIGEELVRVKSEGNSWGGICEVRVQGVPKGLGQPVFHKLKSDLAAALMSVGAVSAVELGEGLHRADRAGLDFHGKASEVYGGIRGGISTGEDVVMRAHIKPTSSLLDVAKRGRHDPAVIIRAVPVLEAMVAWVVADHLLWQRLDRIR